jgi:hypothetical protein
MNKFTQQYKIYLTGILFLAIFTLLVFLVIVPLIFRIKSGGSELSENKQQSEIFYQNQQNLVAAKKDYEKISDSLSQFPMLLSRQDAIKFIETAEDIARTTNNRETITALENSPTATQNQTRFQISLWGNFPNLLKFLIYLENAPYYNDIQSLQITALGTASAEQAQGPASDDVRANINLGVYLK